MADNALEIEGGFWEHFDHEADIGVRGVGKTLETAFIQAATALTAVVCDPATVDARRSIQVRCSGRDERSMLVEWLNTLVYEMATRSMLFARFELSIRDHQLRATLWGEEVDRKKHRPVVEVKGATYTALKVGQDHDGSWIAQCVLDV